MQNRFSNDSFNQLVSKLFSCNFVLIVSESAQHFSRHKFDDNFDNILNQFSVLTKLNLTIRDLCGHNAYALNSLHFRFADWTVLKSRPNASQIKKLQFDLISSMSSLLYSSSDQTSVDESVLSSTPWYHKWKHLFIDTFELSEHDFIGTNFGCFFVITDQELENFKDIFATLITQIKHQSWIRWIQPDFVRYYLVLSEQSLQTHISMNTPKASLYRELQSIYPNSYWLQIDSTSVTTDLNEDVFCDNNKTVVKYDSTDNCIHLPPFEISGDPLNAGINSKLNNNGRMSSGSDQSLRNSVQNLSLNDLSERYLQIIKPKTTFEGMAAIFESMLKEFITKTLIPWAEKQIKLLGEAIAQRKGFRRSIFSATKSLINNMSSSTVGLKGQPMSQSVVYLLEAPEMQLRKLGDLSMSLTMYELAYNSFYSAKKDFQSENAWLYYAAASEASAIASYYTNKFQRHYFEQSINCYVDTCRAMSSATRATILATEAGRQLWPNEAANLFIRMTGDDSDLRSALFLEQASKCFLEAGHRTRKSAFHYVLAGHRYNRCGLKHFALTCYRQFSGDQWSAAADHVSLTVARLFLAIANTNQNLSSDYRAQGLEILRSNANKQLFFQEFMREIKRDVESTQNNDTEDNYYYLDLPFILSVSFDPIEGVGQQKSSNLCFVSEELLLKLCLRTPFQLVLHQLKFFTNNSSVNCPTITSSLETDEEVVIYLSVVPEIESDFELLGLEFKCEDLVRIKCRFSDKLLNGFKFRAIKTLPAIGFDIRFQTPLNAFQTTNTIEVFANEVIDLTLGLTTAQNGWTPSTVKLTTNAVLLDNAMEEMTDNSEIKIDFDSQIAYKIHIPSELGQHIINFRLTYTEDSTNSSRVLSKAIVFEVKECLYLETSVESVVSLRNSLAVDPVFVKSLDDTLSEIPANLTAHLLSNGLTIIWSQPNGRYGVIRL